MGSKVVHNRHSHEETRKIQSLNHGNTQKEKRVSVAAQNPVKLHVRTTLVSGRKIVGHSRRAKKSMMVTKGSLRDLDSQRRLLKSYEFSKNWYQRKGKTVWPGEEF